MNQENINKELTEQEMVEVVGEEIDAKIRRREIMLMLRRLPKLPRI